jgi:hypothetical protein
LQWVDFDGSPESFRAVSTKPLPGPSALEQGIAVFHRWADMQGRKLDECKSLPDVFKRCKLEQVECKVASTDTDASTRAECGHTMIVTFDRLLHDFAKVPGSGKYNWSPYTLRFLFLEISPLYHLHLQRMPKEMLFFNLL